MHAMNLLMLPGNSPSNKEWTHILSGLLLPHFSEVKIVEYESWRDNDFSRVIDLEEELVKVSKVVRKWDQYCIFAKSVGTALCMKAVAEKAINPQKCMFVGIPLEWLSANNILISNWVKDYHVPTMVVQQKNDPFGNAKIVSDFLLSIDSIANFSTIEGDDHNYSDVALLISKAVSFFSEK